MNRFYIIPGVENGKGIVRVLQTEHNGHTRSVYEENDITAKRMDYIADAFARAARELRDAECRCENRVCRTPDCPNYLKVVGAK